MGIPEADKPEDFITALVKLQKDCGVDDLRMSDYGFAPDESMRLAVNARETMGGLFLANPCEMTDEECADIFEKSYQLKPIIRGSLGGLPTEQKPVCLALEREDR